MVEQPGTALARAAAASKAVHDAVKDAAAAAAKDRQDAQGQTGQGGQGGGNG